MTTEKLFEDHPNIIVYDFEVFPKYWCMVFIDKRVEPQVIESAAALRNLYNTHKDHIWIGYNSNHYDRHIFSGVYYDSDQDSLYQMSQELVSSGYTKRGAKLDDFISYDTGDRFRSLKQYEAFMGHSIEESSIPFDYQLEFTQEQKEEVWKYCRHDVLETVEVLKRKVYDFEAQKNLIETFGLPETDYCLTKAQLTAKVLECQRYEWMPNIDGSQERVEMDYSGEEWANTILPCVEINKYTDVLKFFQDSENYKDNQKWKGDICGVQHTFGLGGIHGAVKKYHKKGSLLHVDVTSYYPSIMIQWDLLTRRTTKPDKFRQIYDTRVKLKAEGKKKEQAPYKIILNSTFGITNQKTSAAYDPRRNHEVCINGQLMLLMLLEMLEGHCRLVQSNTDGIILDYEGYDRTEIYRICDEWCKKTRMSLGYDEIDEIWQKDVNNYLFRFSDGKYEAKGAYVKFNDDLDNDMAIVNEAVRAGLINGSMESINDYIDSCDDLVKFQKVVKLSSLYKYVCFGGNRIENHKCIRIYAAKDHGEIISKQKRDGGTFEKYANTPENGVIVFGDLSDSKLKDYSERPFSIDRVDKEYYKQLARGRYLEFVGTAGGKQ